MRTHIASALRTFRDGLDRASGLRSIFDYLSGIAPVAMNCDDILRSSVVLAVSSFDLFLHDVFRTEAVYRLTNKKIVLSLKVPFESAFETGSSQAKFIEESIRIDNSYKSFVAPDKLADCLRPLIDAPWDKIAAELGEPANTCKGRLKGVVDLRNRIAHEADVKPLYGGLELWPIYSQDVEKSIDYLRQLGFCIAQVVSDN